MNAYQKRPIKKKLLNHARERARKLGLPFTLTEKDIEVPTHCPILRIKLVNGTSRDKAASPSIDRIIPRLGYVPGNVCVISHRANMIKNNATISEMAAVLNYMVQNRR